MEEPFIPPTLMECFRIIEQEVPTADVEACRNFPDGRFPDLDHHLGWGLYLRNRFIHPKHSLIRTKFRKISFIFEPDGMSSAMKQLFWMYLNSYELDAPLIAQMWLERHTLVLGQMNEQCLDKIEDLLGQ